MSQKWSTKHEDLATARKIMEEYATKNKLHNLGLFELVVDEEEKKMDFKLSPWVGKLANHFQKAYGDEKGDRITRRVISKCITKENTVH